MTLRAPLISTVTVQRAQLNGSCYNCIHRKRGPGRMQCLHPETDGERCPGRRFPGEDEEDD